MSEMKIYQNLQSDNNFKGYFTPRKVMDAILPTTYCHDIVGIVRTVETKLNYARKVMNFVIQIEDGSTWAVAAWEEDADRLKEVVLIDHVIAIDGIYAKFGDVQSRFTQEKAIAFTVQTSTLITNLTQLYSSKTETQKNVKEAIKMYDDIQICVDENDENAIIGLTLYIKSAFVQGNPAISLRFGALTDKKIKITTIIKNYNDSRINYKVGQKLKVIGKLSDWKGKIALEIAHLADITILDDEECTSDILRNVVKTPKKREIIVNHVSGKSVAKKLKMDS